MNLSCGGMLARDVIGKKFGWVVMPDRVANLTVVHRGRPACHYCDECQRGCHTASYFNSPSVTLPAAARTDRKSTRLNSSHGYISYAVFCLKKKKNIYIAASVPPARVWHV